jgi:hypothetical protein
MIRLSRNKGRVAASLVAIALFGCSTANSNPQITAAGNKLTPAPPAVQDCARITSGSPSKYQCGDQTYTSYEFTKMQRDYAAQQNSGK